MRSSGQVYILRLTLFALGFDVSGLGEASPEIELIWLLQDWQEFGTGIWRPNG